MKFLKKYFLNQISEIKKSKALIYFGLFLSLTHILSFYFWDHLGFYHFTATNHPSNICWVFFENCEFLRFSSVLSAQVFFFIYLIIAFISTYLFLIKKVKYGYFSLLFLTLFKFFILLMSFKAMGNYHYMPFVISFLYLLFPLKKASIPIMTVMFYIFAGFLKLNNMEWLTGGSLYKIETWNIYFILFLTHFVVLLEIFIAPFLLLKHFIKYIAFIFFLIFHLASYYWVGYFYPLNCFALLSIFPLLWFLEGSHINLIKKLLKDKFPKIIYFVFILFILAQVLPKLYRGDEAVTGEGRTWSLNMYDARISCQSYMKLRYKNRTEEFSRSSDWLAVRVKCDPYVYYTDAKKACFWAEKNPDFLDLDFHLSYKRKSDLEWSKLVKITDFCSKDINYHFLRSNKWILRK